jgi:hypothetical protein
MAQDHTWYNAAMANMRAGRLPSDNNPISDGFPQAGYYWVREAWIKNEKKIYGPRIPIAIWQDEYGWTVEPHQYPSGTAFTAESIWTWAAHHPISYQVYCHVAEDGQPWPDEVEIKSNTAGMTDAERLKALYNDLLEQSTAWLKTLKGGKASTQVEADKAINFANGFAVIAKEAKQIHDVEKAPNLAEAKEIDDRYLPTYRDSLAKSKTVKQVSSEYMLAEDTRRKAEAAAENAQRAREGSPPVVAEPVKAGSGPRRSSIREETVYDIVDLKVLAAWIADLNPSDLEFVKCVHAIGTRQANVGIKVPGLSPPRIINKVV